MSVLYTLLIMFVFAKLIIKCRTRRSYFLTGTIIFLVVVLSDIPYIIDDPKHYFIYSFWQVLLAYIIYLVYAFLNSSSIKRNRDFNKKIRTQTKPYFHTQRANGLYLIITSFIILLVGITLLIIKLLDIFNEIPYVVFIGSVIGFIGFLATGIIYIQKANEKFVLLVRTSDSFATYVVNIEKGFKFNYMNYIGDIYKYYIIEKIGTFKYSGEAKEIHYVWILDTENLNNYDISKLPMEKSSKYWYNEIVNDVYKFRNTKFNIEVQDNKIKNVK